MNLQLFDAKRIALVLHHVDWRRIVLGLARYERDPVLGPVLRIYAPEITSTSVLDPQFVLQESTWDGDILPDEKFGCDYTLNVHLA